MQKFTEISYRIVGSQTKFKPSAITTTSTSWFPRSFMIQQLTHDMSQTQDNMNTAASADTPVFFKLPLKYFTHHKKNSTGKVNIYNKDPTNILCVITAVYGAMNWVHILTTRWHYCCQLEFVLLHVPSVRSDRSLPACNKAVTHERYSCYPYMCCRSYKTADFKVQTVCIKLWLKLGKMLQKR